MVVTTVFFATAAGVAVVLLLLLLVIAVGPTMFVGSTTPRENGIVIIGELSTRIVRRRSSMNVVAILLLPFQFQTVNGLFQ